MKSRKQKNFDEVREQVKQGLMEKEHQEVMENWEDDLLQSSGFVVYEEILKEALAEQKSSGV